MIQATKIIKRSVITEKSLLDASLGEYTFEVVRTANKREIAQAVAEIFKVDVKSVRTRIVKNRKKRIMRSRQTTVLPAIKKASVKIGKDQKIDIFEVKS